MSVKHLRNEWWKSLKPSPVLLWLKNDLLTATPPYEGDPALGIAISACVGRLMRKLLVPELVKEELLSPLRLCLLCLPTKEERYTDAFSQQRSSLQQLTRSPLCQYQNCQALSGQINSDTNASMSPSISLLPWSFFFLEARDRLSQTFAWSFRS